MVYDKVRQMLADQLGFDIELINEDTDIMEDLGADSLDLVELMMSVEEVFFFTVSDEDLVGMKTVADVVKYIEEKTA